MCIWQQPGLTGLVGFTYVSFLSTSSDFLKQHVMRGCALPWFSHDEGASNHFNKQPWIIAFTPAYCFIKWQKHVSVMSLHITIHFIRTNLELVKAHPCVKTEAKKFWR